MTSIETRPAPGEVADPAGEFGRLTDAAFARSRERLGLAQPVQRAPHNLEVTWDGTRRFAIGYGDDNPLFCDPDYAAGSRWGGIIAPPGFNYTMGEDVCPPLDAATKAVLKGDPFAGLGSYQAVMDFEWWEPMRLGERCRLLLSQVGVQDKPSRFGGRTAHVTKAFTYGDGAGRPRSIRRGTWINAERGETKSRSSEVRQPPVYSAEDIAAIDALYAAEERRGRVPRDFEEVEIGDVIQQRVKGPLTTTDLIVWHLGWGMQLTPPGAFRVEWLTRRKAPGLYPPNAQGIPDTVQRLHWENGRAQELGLPASYDYGAMREAWIMHAITDWMGDDAWLWRLRCEHRKFNYLGDTTWVTGEVVGKEIIDGRGAVHLELRCTNQDGLVTTPATATVLLPLAGSPPELPPPPGVDLQEVVAAEVRRWGLI